MILSRLDISGYRRFSKVSVDLDGEVIAIIGRNESGDNTILQVDSGSYRSRLGTLRQTLPR